MTNILGCLIYLFVATGPLPQASSPPDVSGHWVFVAPGTEALATPPPSNLRGPNAPRGSYGPEFNARQDNQILTIEAKVGPSVVKMVYDLRGTETRQTVAANLPQISAVVLIDPQDKTALIIVSRFVDERGLPVPGEIKRIHRLLDDSLMIETISTSGKPGEETREVSVYRRAKASGLPAR